MSEDTSWFESDPIYTPPSESQQPEVEIAPPSEDDSWFASDPIYDPQAEAETKRRHIDATRNMLINQDINAGRNQEPPEEFSLYERAGLGFGQGLSGLTDAAGGLLQGVGARDTGASLSRYAKKQNAELQEYGDLDPSVSGSIVQHLSAGLTEMVPMLATGALAGVPGIMVESGLQAFGGTYSRAKDAYEESGLSADDAAKKAYGPALASGLISATLMGGFGKLGGEAIQNGLAAGTVRAVVGQALKQAGAGAGITGVQSIADSIVEKASYNPKKSLGDIVQEAVLAAAEGGAIGAVMAGAGSVGKLARDAYYSKPVAELARDLGQQARYARTAINELLPKKPIEGNFEMVGREQAPAAGIQSDPIIDVASEVRPTLSRRRLLGQGEPEARPSRQAEVVPEPIPEIPFEPAQRAQPMLPEVADQLRVALETNMQGRSMEFRPADIVDPKNPHLNLLLRNLPGTPKGTTWADLADAGLVKLEPTKTGVEVSVNYPQTKQSPAPMAEQLQPIQPKVGGIQNGQKIQTQEALQQNGEQEKLLTPVPAVPLPTRETVAVQPESFVQEARRRGYLSKEDERQAAWLEETAAKFMEKVADKPQYAQDEMLQTWQKHFEDQFPHGGRKPAQDLKPKEKTEDRVLTEEKYVQKTLNDKDAEHSWALENLPFGRIAKLPEKNGALVGGSRIMSLLDDAGIPLSVRMEIVSGERPYPTMEAFQKGVDSHYFEKADYLRDKLVSSLRKHGYDDASSKLSKRKDFKTGKDYFQTMSVLEKKALGGGVFMSSRMMDQGVAPKPESVIERERIERVAVYPEEFPTSKADDKTRKLIQPVPPTVKESLPVQPPVVPQGTVQAQIGEAPRVQKPQMPEIDGEVSLMAKNPSPTVTGLQGMRMLLNHPSAKMDPDVVKVSNHLLDTLEKAGVDLSAMDLTVADDLSLGRSSQAGFVDSGSKPKAALLGNSLVLSKQSDPSTFPHEMSHFLDRLIPEEDKVKIEAYRLKLVKKMFGQNVPPDMTRKMTSSQFAESGLPMEAYHLSNGSEFLAHFVGDKFAKETLEPKDRTLWNRIRELLKLVWDKIKNFFGAGDPRQKFYDDMVAGKYQADPKAGERFEEMQAAYVKNETEARNSLLRHGGDQKNLEMQRDSVHASVTPFLSVIQKHLPTDASPMAQKKSGLFDLLSIQSAIGNLPAETYAQIKARYPNSPEYIQQLGFETAVRMVVQNKAWNSVIKEQEAQAEKITSPVFLRRLGRLNDLELEAESLKNTMKNFEAQAADVMATATRVLKEEAGNSGAAAAILKEVQQSLERRSAIESAIKDIINVLASKPETAMYLYHANGDVKTFLDDYMRRKAEMYARDETTQPIDPIIVKWAAEILARGKENTRKMVVSALLNSNAEFRKALTAEEKRVADGLRDNPEKTIREMLRTERKNVANEISSREAFKTLKSEVLDELKDYKDLTDARQIIEGTKGDSDYVALLNESAKDGGIQFRPNGKVKVGNREVNLADLPYEWVGLRHDVLTPNGEIVTIDMGAEKAAFEAERAKLAAVQGEWLDWKEKQDALPENLRDPTYQYHMARLKHITSTLLSSSVTNPPGITALSESGKMASTFNMIEEVTQAVETRLGVATTRAGAVFNRSHFLSSALQRKYLSLLSEKAFEAARSMGFTNGRGNNEAALFLADEVLRPLFALGQQPGAEIKSGMVVGKGYVVTQPVIDLYRLQTKVSGEGYDIIQKTLPERMESAFTPVLKTMVGDAEVFGKSIKTSPWTLPSSGWNQDAFNFTMAHWKAKDTGKTAESTERLETNFDLIASYLRDRASIMAFGPSPHENAYALVTQRIQDLNQNGNLGVSKRNLNWVAEQVAEISGEPVDDVKAVMVDELEKLIHLFRNKLDEEDMTQTHGTMDRKTSFTQRRALIHELPDYFVNYGWHTSSDFQKFVYDLHSYHFARFGEGLDEVRKELVAQRAALKDDAKTKAVIEGISEKDAEKKIVDQNKREVLMSRAYQKLEFLDDKINRIERLLEKSGSVFADKNSGELEHMPGWGFVNSMTGGAISSVGSMARNGMSTVQLANQINNYTNNFVLTVAKSFQHWLWHGLTKNLGGFAVGGLKAGVKLPGSLIQAFKAYKTKGAGGAFGTFLRRAFDEFTNGSVRMVDSYKEMEELGMVPFEEVGTDFTAKMMSLSTRGLIIREDRSAINRQAATLGTLFNEVLLPQPIRAVAPRFGDSVTNSSGFTMAEWTLRKIEARLRKVYSVWSKAGLQNRFDANNPRSQTNNILATEMYPGIFGFKIGPEAKRKLEHTILMFNKADLDFQDMVKDFIKDLADGKPGAQFGTKEQRDSVKQQILFDINVPSATNRSLDFQTRGWGKLFGLLQGYSVKAVRTFTRLMGRATSPETARFWAWMAVATLVVPIIYGVNASSDVIGEEIIRLLYKYVYGTERATRQPWEQDGAKRQAVGWLLAGLNPIPYVSLIANSTLGNDMPSRASFDITPVAVNKTKDLFQYLGGVVQTGDPTYGLAKLTESIYPWTQGIINRMDSQSGLVDMNNAARLLRRYGDTDLLKPQGAVVNAPKTPLTPLIQQMENAMGRGDIPEFTRLKEQAEAKAMELGKDPGTVKQSFEARNPYTKVFTGKITDDQRQAILDKMTDSEKQTLLDAEQKFAAAHDVFGGKEKTFTISQEQTDKRQAKRDDRIANFQSGSITPSQTTRNPGTNISGTGAGRIQRLVRQPSTSIAGLSRLAGKARKVRLTPIKSRGLSRRKVGPSSRVRKPSRGLRRR